MSAAAPGTPLRTLRKVFGFRDFRPMQEEIVTTLLGGQNALVLMPTGGGKSLCYQLPALVREGCGVVVSPLIALMKNQVDALRQYGVRAAFLNSSLNYGEALEVEREFRRGALDLLYIAPERLLTERTLELLTAARIALFAIDEAHCVSHWGHDFRPEYRQLSLLCERFPEVPRIALTATASRRTREEIAAVLGLDGAQRFITGFDRPNIRYTIYAGAQAQEALWRFLANEHARDSGIVYCMTRKRTEQAAAWLTRRGRQALPYHAGLPAPERRRNQERFLQGDDVIIVATIAFGMGIDKPNARFVAHLNLPKSIESYYQETGRAGRDGLPANAWMSYSLQDAILLRQLLANSELKDERMRIEHRKIEALLGMCETSGCRRQVLLGHFGETLPAPCGNCDNCLQPPRTEDGTVAAQKALSCIYRTGQRFGVNYLIDVLLGKDDPRIRRFGHDRIKTYGIGGELSAIEWRGLFRQAIAAGLATVEDEHGSLKLTAASRAVLRGERGFEFRRPAPRAAAGSRRSRRPAAGVTAQSAQERELFEALRRLRTELAQRQGIPSYIIFHDTTLIEMAQTKPQTLAEMAQISGIGERKLERYGEDFLALLNQA
ncbi:MAG: DNA helicase RecQ [Gammaproteobacteria bacterium]|nr:DNA helicase RecQ [Gammaproteobacteria bacterium]